MSMADNIKKGIKQKRNEFSSEEELRGLINSATSKALKQFIQRMEAGEVPIDNISDMVRVIGAYKEINGISEVMEGKAGQSALPEINMRQERVLEDVIQDGKASRNEEDRIDIMDMSVDDVADLIRKMDTAQNSENEGAF